MNRSLLFVLTLALSACTSDNQTIRTLKAAGFSDIQTTGWAPFSCSHDDTVKTGFRAKNSNGQVVTGAVCCGLIFKNCTVRF